MYKCNNIYNSVCIKSLKNIYSNEVIIVKVNNSN